MLLQIIERPYELFWNILKDFNGRYGYVLDNNKFLLKNKDIFSLIENYILHIRNKINSDDNLQYHIELSNIYEEINKKANIKDINNYILNKVN